MLVEKIFDAAVDTFLWAVVAIFVGALFIPLCLAMYLAVRGDAESSAVMIAAQLVAWVAIFKVGRIGAWGRP